MSTKSLTREERFLIALYTLSKKNNTEFCSIDEIAQSLHLHERQSKTTVQVLTSINFTKKRGKKEIKITTNGISLAEELLAEI